jgi:hypothetical protein
MQIWDLLLRGKQIRYTNIGGIIRFHIEDIGHALETSSAFFVIAFEPRNTRATVYRPPHEITSLLTGSEGRGTTRVFVAWIEESRARGLFESNQIESISSDNPEDAEYIATSPIGEEEEEEESNSVTCLPELDDNNLKMQLHILDVASAAFERVQASQKIVGTYLLQLVYDATRNISSHTSCTNAVQRGTTVARRMQLHGLEFENEEEEKDAVDRIHYEAAVRYNRKHDKPPAKRVFLQDGEYQATNFYAQEDVEDCIDPPIEAAKRKKRRVD